MMLIDYIRAAIGHARYELLDDDEGFYGDIGRNLLARVLGKTGVERGDWEQL